MNRYKEALDELSFPLDDSSCGGCKCGTSDCQDCKKALAVFKLQELVEKATPKKPTEICDDDICVYCPYCREEVYKSNYENYCPNCGQALDWSEEE